MSGDDRGDDTSSAMPNQRRLVILLALGTFTLVLSVSGVGFIPVPNSTANATLMHVPVVLAGIFGGPVAGLGVGLVFGVSSWMDGNAPIFHDPLVAILPRGCIGMVAGIAFLRLRRTGVMFAAAVAAALGSITNTVGVLVLAILLARFPVSAVPAVFPQAALEILVAAPIAALAVLVVGKLPHAGHDQRR